MPSEQEPSADQPSLYVQAARFTSERKAGRAYFACQEAIFKVDSDLSAYRLILNRVWHVTVLGTPPPEELDQTIRKILAAGEPTTLPTEVLTTLLERRAQQVKLGYPWLERHHRPGQPF